MQQPSMLAQEGKDHFMFVEPPLNFARKVSDSS